MPWWIWLILALFMIAMLVAGVIYAGLHGMHALQKVSTVGEKISDRLNQMSEHYDGEEQSQRAIFTEPLKVAADRYADSHAEVIKRHERKRDGYALTWKRWSQFNQ